MLPRADQIAAGLGEEPTQTSRSLAGPTGIVVSTSDTKLGADQGTPRGVYQLAPQIVGNGLAQSGGERTSEACQADEREVYFQGDMPSTAACRSKGGDQGVAWRTSSAPSRQPAAWSTSAAAARGDAEPPGPGWLNRLVEEPDILP